MWLVKGPFFGVMAKLKRDTIASHFWSGIRTIYLSMAISNVKLILHPQKHRSLAWIWNGMRPVKWNKCLSFESLIHHEVRVEVPGEKLLEYITGCGHVSIRSINMIIPHINTLSFVKEAQSECLALYGSGIYLYAYIRQYTGSSLT